MYISKLSIRNYRNFKNVSLNFNKGVNTIIGENGSGKTNLFNALRILIDESMPRNIRFYESDFNRALGPWLGHWIIIQIEFSELDSSEEAQAIAMHKVGDVDQTDKTKGAYTVFFRPRLDIRRNLFDLSEEKTKTKGKLEEILNKISLNDYEVVYTGRGNINFSDDINYSKYVGDFENIVFPDPDNEQSDVYGIKMYGVSIPNEFACTFAKALRDVESDLRSFRNNPLINLLRDKESKIEISEKEKIEKQVETLNEDISKLDEVKNVSDGIGKSIKEAVGETYAPNISIKSELPDEMENLLQSLKLWVGDPDEVGHEGRLWELSLGGANLIYLSLKLLEFEKVKKPNKIANFIIIEEPEAHIHTHIQKTLFDRIEKKNTQVFISTHSTHISSVSNIGSMNILARTKQQVEAYSPSNKLNSDEITRLERYLDANRTNLLFAKGIMLVEGDAEQILIPVLVKKVFGLSLDELGISLINIGSTGFQNIAMLFSEDRVKRHCAIITDLDTSILPLPENSDEDTTFERGCRNSQISGANRKIELDGFCSKNDYVDVFYGKHTFEVDFLEANNSHEVIQVVKKEYSQKKKIETISARLENPDVAVSGKEILRLADKYGKGWFAIMLTEQIYHLSEIPEHILKAIVFALPNLTDQILVSIMTYRLNNLSIDALAGDKENYEKHLVEFNKQLKESSSNAVAYFKKALTEDVVTKLLSFYHA